MKMYAQEILEAAYIGFAISISTRRYPNVLINEGLSGIERIVMEQRHRELLAKARRLRKAGLVKMRRIGDHLQVELTKNGQERLLKMRLKAAPRLPGSSVILVAFDFPVTQRKARDAFRHLLKGCGLKKMQQSLWTTRQDVSAPLQDLIAKADAQAWVTIFRAEKA